MSDKRDASDDGVDVVEDLASMEIVGFFETLPSFIRHLGSSELGLRYLRLVHRYYQSNMKDEEEKRFVDLLSTEHLLPTEHVLSEFA